MDGFRANTNAAAEPPKGASLVAPTASASSSLSSNVGNSGGADAEYSTKRSLEDSQSPKKSSSEKVDKLVPARAASSDASAADRPAAAAEEDADGTGTNQHHPIAEFLYQLIKMLEDDNSEIIEWADGRIKVHHPQRLEAEVLSRYFRHSKFASFQRQLNYFGFRKIAGKGKMSPCSYVNDAATSDIRSLLTIKRKTNGSAARKAAMNRAMAAGANMNMQMNLGALGAMGQMGQVPGVPGGMMLSESMLRLQLLQQQQQQQQFAPDQNALNALFQNAQKRQSLDTLARLNMNQGLQNAQAQAALAQLQGFAAAGGAQGQASMQATAALGGAQNPATAAMGAMNPASNAVNQMPATAAMNAFGKDGGIGESNPTLDSFVNEQQQLSSNNKKQAPTVGSMPGRVTNQSFLNARLPSSNTLFPDSASTASLTHLMAGNLGSQNRLSSMASLNGYMSREPSMVDLLIAQGGAAAAAANGQYPGMQGMMPQQLALAGLVPPGLLANAARAPQGAPKSPGFANGQQQ